MNLDVHNRLLSPLVRVIQVVFEASVVEGWFGRTGTRISLDGAKEAREVGRPWGGGDGRGWIPAQGTFGSTVCRRAASLVAGDLGFEGVVGASIAVLC
jgi:hypothetical protein